MKIKKLILAVLVVGVFNFLVGMLTCGGAFSWVYKLEPVNVWKPIESISFPIMVASIFFVDLLFVSVYVLIKNGIPGKNNYVKGILYGLFVCLIGLLPGMISTYLYMTVAPIVVIYWTIWGFIVSPVKGLIAAAIYGE